MPDARPNDDDMRSSPPLPSQIGKYRVVGYLASGSFGTVYEGYYRILEQQRRVAIKTLKTAVATDAASTARFREEVRTLCLLDHPNVCKVIDGGIEEGLMFLVMDFAEGGSLKAKLKQAADGRIDWRQAVVWLREAANGLLAAETHHDSQGEEAPIYHRDVKPENLLLKQGRVVVADFGAAKLGGDNPDVTSDAIPAVWTPNYGSPEQMSGNVDHRSDIYSLGATFFHLLTGDVTGARFANRLDRFSEPHDPSRHVRGVPRKLGAIVRRMTEPRPLMRFQSFRDVLEALDEFERPRAGRWALVVTAALALAAAGVWYAARDRVVILSEGLTLAQHEALLGGVRGRLPDVATDWDGLDALRQQWLQCQQEIAANGKLLEELRTQGVLDAQRPQLPAGFHAIQGPTGLGQRVDYCVQRLAELTPLRDDLRRLEAAWGAMAGADARSRSEALVGRLRQAADADGLRSGLEALEQKIAAAAAARAGRLEDLARSFNAGDFDRVQAIGDAFVADMTKVSEQELVDKGRQFLEGAQEARRIESVAPKWPAPGGAAKPLDDLAGVDAARAALVALDPVDRHASLGAWWTRFTARLRAGWADAMAVDVDERAAALRLRLDAFDAAVKAATAQPANGDALFRERAQLLADVVAWRELVEQVRERQRADIDSTKLNEALRRARVTDPATLPAILGIDLTAYRDALAAPLPERPPDPVLAQPHEQLLAARQRLVAALQAAEASPALPSVGSALRAASADLESAKLDYDGAARTWQSLRDAAAGAATKPASALRQAVAPVPLAAKFPALDQFRQQVAVDIEAIASGRDQRVKSLTTRLRNGEPEPAGLVRDAEAAATDLAQCGEQQLAEAARSVAAAAQQAVAHVANWPEPSLRWQAGSKDDVAFAAIADYDVMLTAAKAVVGGDGSDLAAWWSTRRRALVASWMELADGHWQAVHAANDRAVRELAGRPQADPLRPRAQKARDDAEKARMQLKGLADRMSISDVDRAWGRPLAQIPTATTSDIAYPDGWPDQRFLPPAGVQSLAVTRDEPRAMQLYGEEFVAEAQARGLRLWFVPARKGHDGEPVLMAWCQDADGATAALVDVHPVTLGELNLRRDARQVPGFWHPGFDAMPPATLAYNTSAKVADRLVTVLRDRAVGPDARPLPYSLPPAGYRAWPTCAPRGARPPRLPQGAFPSAGRPLADLSPCGLAFVQSGVKEWTSDNACVGEADIPPSSRDAAVRRDTGFRMALVLQHSDR